MSTLLLKLKEYSKWCFLLGTFLFLTFIGLYLLNWFSEKYYGAGNIVTYYPSTLYGYRPSANQIITRKGSDTISINNLSIRANTNWESTSGQTDKILFLGDSITYGGIHLPNEVLFPELAVKPFKGYSSGNAGVNGWGVLNVKGLIVDKEFTPAKTYVTTLIEEDFLRGLVRIKGGPFRMTNPKFGLDEWAFRLLFMLYNKALGSAPTEQDEDLITKCIAVKNLKEMDTYLKEKGYQHLIFISPSRDQVHHRIQKDNELISLFRQYKLSPIYILDELEKTSYTVDEKESIFYDSVHLTVEGHQVWAKIYQKHLKNILPTLT